ncbi:hypothetical protein EPO33_00435 [Patescibacteria group bacterium]|nr:MAG: hypothetical protein EPO33_00435 [Patescibacteria group bacterium]
MNTLNVQKCGLIFGSFLGLWHLVWSLLVLLGLAQPFLDFIFRLHMITPPYTVLPFNLGSAIGLVVVTFLFGYVVGWVLAMIWNTVVKMK